MANTHNTIFKGKFNKPSAHKKYFMPPRQHIICSTCLDNIIKSTIVLLAYFLDLLIKLFLEIYYIDYPRGIICKIWNFYYFF